ncbi:hypothetical protein [Pleionea sediminis]|uniref:hypothetical protein n=1 Tax=Pleionea sediminis TaxID=2569479 RepID=UPI00118704BE|nr:hypothetical protein [Pleionea sediminis]
MDFIGKINFKELDEGTINSWCNLIESKEYLAWPEKRIGINPFSGEETEFNPKPTTAKVMSDGKIHGDIFAAENGSPFLWVTCYDNLAFVEEKAKEIAATIGGEYKSERLT